MNVLHINFDVDSQMAYWVGGVPSVVQNILKYTKSEDLHHFLLTADCRYSEYKRENDVHIVPCQRSRRNRFLANPANMLSILRGIDIVHFHHPVKKKLSLWIKLLKPRLRIIETIYSRPVRDYSLSNILVDQTIAIDNDLYEHLLSRGFPRKRLSLVGIIPDFDRYNFSNYEPERKVGGLKIWFSAGARKEMGLFYLLEEIKEINSSPELGKRFEFIISIADHPGLKAVKGEVEKIISSYGLNNVRLTGWFEDVPRFMNSVDIVVFPIIDHRDKMNTPLMMLEAMLMKKLIISTPTGGIPEVIDRKNGILFNQKGQSLRDVLQKIDLNSIPLLQERARETVLKKFLPEKKRLTNLYFGLK